jgi:hypothetical protein
MWPTSFALTALTAADEERIGALVQQAVAEDERATRPCPSASSPSFWGLHVEGSSTTSSGEHHELEHTGNRRSRTGCIRAPSAL